MSAVLAPAAVRMPPTDPRTLALLDRFAALRMEAEEMLVKSMFALAATERVLHSARAVLCLPSVTPDEVKCGAPRAERDGL